MVQHSKPAQWLSEPAHAIDADAQRSAKAYQETLTKPPGSLGVLELIATRFAGFQGRLHPQLNAIDVSVFAADHGICAQGVSAFPQQVTAQMIANFVSGGAAISVLCKQYQAKLYVVNLGTVDDSSHLPGVHHHVVANTTADFSLGEAMTEKQLAQALEVGKKHLQNRWQEGQKPDLFIGGEMGIGNTSSASAIYSLLLNTHAQQTVGPGTGLNEQQQQHKVAVIETALRLHAPHCQTPFDILRCVGGFEIAALTAAYLYCAQQGVPVLIDGFICTAAALLAQRINSSCTDWFIFSHQSAEPAHVLALNNFDARALLNLGMRLGEGSGAAIAIPLIQSALNLHNQMATFRRAAVSQPPHD